MEFADFLIKCLLGYLLGSVSGSLLLGRFRGVDIRKQGSGNAGGTNAFRTQGLWFAIGVLVIDVGKGALAAGLLPGLNLGLPQNPDHLTVLQACAGFAAVVGHCYPVFHGFRGGKGAGTAVGVVAVIAPWCIIPMLVLWLGTLAVTGYVGLGTMLAAVALIPAIMLLGPKPLPAAYLAFSMATAGFLLYTHRGNISRMRQGEENRFGRDKR